MSQRKSLGTLGENLASQLLIKKKYRILKRNLNTRLGEIDILALDNKTLVIVEVKAKSSDNLGAAIEMITLAKRQKLILLAHQLQSQYQTNNVRIDIVTIDGPESNCKVRHHKGMIEFNG